MNFSFTNLLTSFYSSRVTNTENELDVHLKKSPRSSPKLSLPKLSLIHPAAFPEYKEECFSDSDDSNKEITPSFVLLSPVPLEISSTSFRTTYDYYSIVNIINKKLKKYKYIFDKSKNFWLLELEQNIVLRISIFELNNIRVIEVFSLNRKGNFWNVYSKLKEKLNNIQDKDNNWLLEYSSTNQSSRIYDEDVDK
jgi:hypothetical protein